MSTTSQHVRNVPPSLRFDILNRDCFACRYCGTSSADAQLEVDHLVPLAQGGTNEPDNLITACHLCNRGKGDRGWSENGALKPRAKARTRKDSDGLPLAYKFQSQDDEGNKIEYFKKRSLFVPSDYAEVIGRKVGEAIKLLNEISGLMCEMSARYESIQKVRISAALIYMFGVVRKLGEQAEAEREADRERRKPKKAIKPSGGGNSSPLQPYMIPNGPQSQQTINR